jgi:isoquinoline 1-oxidoreductase subunit alpha
MPDINLNGKPFSFAGDPGTPLLWLLRDDANLTGTKFGCGVGQCGACTVHLDGAAVRSCTVKASDAIGKSVVTIEGLAAQGQHPVLRAWTDAQVPQCGYCQPGFAMAAAAALRSQPQAGDADIEAMLSNVCRCGTYPKVREAIALARRYGATRKG